MTAAVGDVMYRVVDDATGETVLTYVREQCQGTTNAGTRCKRTGPVLEGDAFRCFDHEFQRPRLTVIDGGSP